MEGLDKTFDLASLQIEGIRKELFPLLCVPPPIYTESLKVPNVYIHRRNGRD